MPPQIITFYTDEHYEASCRRLFKSLQSHVPSTWPMPLIVRLPDLGSWRSNAFQKPDFIQTAVLGYPNHTILWLDADAEIVASPGLFLDPPPGLLSADIGAVRGRAHEYFMTNTLWINNTDRTLDWLNRWSDLPPNPSKYPTADQDWAAVTARAASLSIYWLPQSYAAIFDWPETINGSPVILQHQASRAARKRERTRP